MQNRQYSSKSTSKLTLNIKTTVSLISLILSIELSTQMCCAVVHCGVLCCGYTRWSHTPTLAIFSSKASFVVLCSDITNGKWQVYLYTYCLVLCWYWSPTFNNNKNQRGYFCYVGSGSQFSFSGNDILNPFLSYAYIPYNIMYSFEKIKLHDRWTTYDFFHCAIINC